MKYVLTVVIVLAALGVGAFLFALSGIYNIAATRPHWGITFSFIELLRDRSIEAHSGGIRAPNLNDPKLRAIGTPHYQGTCRVCHGAPGVPPEEFARGIYPEPPRMASGDAQKELSNSEIYWVVKNGIKMTGMPAFGPTHTEQELWALAAMVRDLPRITPEQYRQMVETARPEKGEKPGQGPEEAGRK